MRLALIAVAGFLLYKWSQGASLTNWTVSSAPPAPAPPSTPTPPPPTAPAESAVLAKLTAVVKGAGASQVNTCPGLSAGPAISRVRTPTCTPSGDYMGTPWQFNYWLNQAVGIDLAPSMGQIFPGCGTGIAGGCDDTPITLTQFWSLAAPWLKSQGSLSGIGSFPHFLGGNRVRMPHRVLAGWR